MQMHSGQIYGNKRDFAVIGAIELGLGAGLLTLSSKKVKDGSWGKTTGNFVNFIGIGGLIDGAINEAKAVMLYMKDKETYETKKAYWEAQGYKVYEE